MHVNSLSSTALRYLRRGISSNITSDVHAFKSQSLNLVARNRLEGVEDLSSVFNLSRLTPPILGTLAGLPSNSFVIYPYFLSTEEQEILLKASLAKLGGRRRQRRHASEEVASELPSHSGHAWGELFGTDKDYTFEEGHFDGVIRDYREVTVSAWPQSSPLGLSRVLLRLYELVDFENTLPDPGLITPPNIQTHVLHLASTGAILPHVDNIEASGSVIAGVSLGNTRVLRLTQSTTDSIEASFDVLLESGSVYIQRSFGFTGCRDNIRYKWKHEIPNVTDFRDRRIGGGQRISVMLRATTIASPWVSYSCAVLPSTGVWKMSKCVLGDYITHALSPSIGSNNLLKSEFIHIGSLSVGTLIVTVLLSATVSTRLIIWVLANKSLDNRAKRHSCRQLKILPKEGRRLTMTKHVLKLPPQKNSPILPAFLVAIISIAAVNIFAPGAVTTVFDTFIAPFKSLALKPQIPPFDVVDIPGRGKGVIANRDIKQGELLIREKPLFIVPTRPGVDPSQLIGGIVDALPSTDKAVFLALSYAKPNVSAQDIPFEIFQTNAISAGQRGTGLFPRTARLNHGCSRAFGAVYSWRDAEGVLEESAASDRRLGQMADAYSMFSLWGSDNIKGTEAIKTAKKIWSIGETEGYISERGQLAADAAHVAAAHGDAKSARQWATLANKWYGIELGADSRQCKAAQAIVHSPSSHAAWGTRSAGHVGGPEASTKAYVPATPSTTAPLTLSTPSVAKLHRSWADMTHLAPRHCLSGEGCTGDVSSTSATKRGPCRLFPQKKNEKRVLIAGLDGAGKTAYLYHMCMGEVVTTIPTIGLNVETVEAPTSGRRRPLRLTCWDVGGCDKIRPLIRHYAVGTEVLVYILDSSDRERLSEAIEELKIMLDIVEDGREQGASPIPCLILANKQDLQGAMGLDEIRIKLVPIISARPACAVFPISVVSANFLSAITPAMDWVYDVTTEDSPKVQVQKSVHIRSEDKLSEKLNSWVERASEDIAPDEFLASFEAINLPSWDHYTHIRIAYTILNTYGRQKGKKMIFDGIEKYIRKSAQTTGRTFHITMTYFWIQIVHFGIQSMPTDDTQVSRGANEDFCRFLLLNPYVADGSLWEDYYSKDVIMTTNAKENMVLPDKLPLPSLIARDSIRK
ncbi:GTP binding [Rhizoctonia solani]|uniref:ADP-ribosylation factor n=1 Tax=Rhizoctonia solani TaxID=456999 RepID=A0A8H7GXV8_9AGAM|nr:GTP binding [Rhizoctonia solani]